jgi:mRNA degradation ribonuclease J1/J2
VLVDGEVLELWDGGARHPAEGIPAGRVSLAGDDRLSPVAPSVVRDRRSLAERGVVLVALALHGATGAVVRGPEVRGRGVPVEGREAELAGEARRAAEGLPAGARRPAAVEGAVAAAVRRWFRREGLQRPAVEVAVLEV